ncbi:hypothetical protein Nepgr_028779 [Nepenthes gracilis]|uniref:H(+)-exporting diphosphatase n=1 Tax=Nepenthes gracilis TaxID=150966 RepID=A0AAD3TD57_NEPGR|nr:hypothetical protein Nepgr_028779 [Nepenthes gracilis]
MVDSKHAGFHLDDVNVNEAVEQIAHADRIIVNKTDLVGKKAVVSLIQRSRNINGMAHLKQAQFGKVDHGHGHHDHHHSHVHTYDPCVSSVSIVCEGNLDLDKANMWLGTLLQDRSEDINRMKGLLSVQGMKERFFFQGGNYPRAAAAEADDVDHFIRNILKDGPRNPVFIAYRVSYDLTTLMYTPLANFVDTLDRLLTTLFATDLCAINTVQEIKLTRVVVGLWSGLILGSVTTYYPSNADGPEQDVADACPPRVAMDVTFSLALSYTPDFISRCAITVSFTSATMYSLTVALPGLLDTISTWFGFDVYGPNSDIDVYGCVRLCMDVYAGGMTEMVGMRYIICTMTDTLDVATMDIGIVIRSTVHLSLAFPSILVSCTSNSTVHPYGFSAMTLMSVISAVQEDVRRLD